MRQVDGGDLCLQLRCPSVCTRIHSMPWQTTRSARLVLRSPLRHTDTLQHSSTPAAAAAAAQAMPRLRTFILYCTTSNCSWPTAARMGSVMYSSVLYSTCGSSSSARQSHTVNVSRSCWGSCQTGVHVQHLQQQQHHHHWQQQQQCVLASASGNMLHNVLWECLAAYQALL
jgi:hypothetical protein